jgi:hypothetical protein
MRGDFLLPLPLGEGKGEGWRPLPLVAFARVDLAGVAAVQQLEQVVLRLAVLAEVADQALGQRGVLDAHVLLAAFAQRAAVEADDGRVAEVAVHAVEAGGVGHRHVGVVGEGHRLADQDLLLLGRVHVALAADDQLGALHGAVAPDLGIVAVVADDQADLQALGPVADVGAVAGVPALHRHPRHDLAVLLHDLALVVHQDERVVRRLVRMLLVPLAGEREHAPHLGLAAGGGEDLGLLARHAGGRVVHLLGVVHDAVGAVLREDHQVHARQAGLHAHQHVGDLACVVQHLGLAVQPRHLVVDHGDADGVLAAGNVAVDHGVLLDCLVADHPGPLGRERLVPVGRAHRGRAAGGAAAAAAGGAGAGGRSRPRARARRMLRALVGRHRGARAAVQPGQLRRRASTRGAAPPHAGQAAGSSRRAMLRMASKPPHSAQSNSRRWAWRLQARSGDSGITTLPSMCLMGPAAFGLMSNSKIWSAARASRRRWARRPRR